MVDHSQPPAGVVVGVDGSPATHGAVAWAAREAARRQVPLDLVQVLPPSERSHDEMRSPSGRAHALLEQARHAAHAVAPDLPVRLAVVDGVVGPALVATAAQARLLVLGARPSGGVADAGVGRTVARAMGHAACPVVVVPARWEPGVDEAAVIVGVDGSTEAEGAVAFGADVAQRTGSSLTAVTVAARSGGETDEDVRRHLAEGVAGTAGAHPDVPLREVVRRGQVAEKLLAEARDGAALLVVGSRGRGAVSGVLLGSTSQRVVHAASCPVAVLSPQAAVSWAHPEQSQHAERSEAGEAS
ncbi:universal stress protein [Actinomycetospora chibensis]|uniref:Universal stress protein n=1 Tax=Actinomycetospora chibensis TaxID=663606 RepID=A0ABV9RM05_9PSEU|nr:universal stress protein [Actinomycetospora chibensis]MDD7927737.1 universal stress protein [Actinomycetospora chibensis]